MRNKADRRTARRNTSRYALGVLMVVLVAGPTRTSANTTTVTTSDDELLFDGDCSLREAIVAANTDTDTDACPAGTGTRSVGSDNGDSGLT